MLDLASMETSIIKIILTVMGDILRFYCACQKKKTMNCKVKKKSKLTILSSIFTVPLI